MVALAAWWSSGRRQKLSEVYIATLTNLIHTLFYTYSICWSTALKIDPYIIFLFWPSFVVLLNALPFSFSPLQWTSQCLIACLQVHHLLSVWHRPVSQRHPSQLSGWWADWELCTQRGPRRLLYLAWKRWLYPGHLLPLGPHQACNGWGGGRRACV